MPLKLIFIFLGAGVGGITRYALTGVIQNWFNPLFPFGTLIVNILGCFAIGFLAAAFAGPVLVREEYRVGILIGLLGGFTTFSAFGRETMALAADREYLYASLNIFLSNLLGLGGVWFGTILARRLYGA